MEAGPPAVNPRRAGGQGSPGNNAIVLAVSRDPLMDVLYHHGIGRFLRRGLVPAAGLDPQTALLARQLELGQPAIMECVAPMRARQRWREMTVEAGHRFTAVECICTDRAVHRARLNSAGPIPADAHQDGARPPRQCAATSKTQTRTSPPMPSGRG
jgi:hypothetical protein